MKAEVPHTAAVLSSEDAEYVLRYWLASLRLEEALSARPRARRVNHPPLPPRVDVPSEGQDYFKLPLTGEVNELASGEGTLQRALEPEQGAYFECWLARRYRRPDDDGDGAHLFCFPVIHLRKGELAGLLRRRVQLRFTTAEGAEFSVPSLSARRRKQFPPPPHGLQLTPAEQAVGDWPYFLDTRLLHQQLGLTTEAIDALFQKLRDATEVTPQWMLQVVAAALWAELDDGPQEATIAAEPLVQLQLAVEELLARNGRGARAFPFGIVVDATQAKTTWHLQKDILQVLQEPLPFTAQLPLTAYLGGPPALQARESQRALFSGPALTTRQRDVAEFSWGSVLSSVQGPPGTGKTTLIQHLCAESLVRQVEELADRGRMGAACLVIASSNNRAVDQVVDAMAQLEAGVQGVLPLALRAGSRQVCEQVLSRQLRRAALFFSQATAAPRGEREQSLEAALTEFRAVRAQTAEQLAPRSHVFERNQRRAQLRHEIAQLPPASAAGLLDAAAADTVPASSTQLLRQCAGLEERLLALSQLCGRKASLASLTAVDREFKRIRNKHWETTRSALETAGYGFPEVLPPALPPTTDVQELLSAWEDAVETALGHVSELRAQLDAAQRGVSLIKLRSRLCSELSTLGQDEALPDFCLDEAHQRALFVAAVDVRLAWAKEQAEVLGPLVERLLYAASEARSPRIIARDNPAGWLMLQRVFGIWGCTLLSLGNCFLPTKGTIQRLVIDEAGQCHPAHAVSGLLRAQAALVIGDVHQLTPVIELAQEDDLRLVRQVRAQLLEPRFARFRIHSESGNSAQSLADKAVTARHELIDHFRCQEAIIKLCDQLCGYGLRVHTKVHSRAAYAPWLSAPLGLIDVQGEQQRAGGSWYNAQEIETTLHIVRALLQSGLSPADLSVITPYRGQLEHLRRYLAQHHVPLERSAELQDSEQGNLFAQEGVALGTVHRFQGGERSIVLFSTVVSSPRSLPFLNQQKNLLNVAISRAQHHLVCIGHQQVLAQGALTRMLTTAAVPLLLR